MLKSVAGSRIFNRLPIKSTLVSCFIWVFFKPDQVVFVFVSLTRSIFCEHLLFTLGKPFDICVLPGFIISGGGPFQWNAVGHHLLDFILE